MGFRKEFDWAGSSSEAQLRHMRGLSERRLNAAMASYDWSLDPETVLGWASAQKAITLRAAFSAFFNGDPGRFNYLAKREISEEYRGVAGLLDNICHRINAGFYLPDTGIDCDRTMRRVFKWIDNQKSDLKTHKRGRWVFEPHVVDTVLGFQRKVLEVQLREEMPEIQDKKPAKSKLLSRITGSLA